MKQRFPAVKFWAIAAISLMANLSLVAQPLTGTYTLPGTVNSTTVNNLTQLATLLNSGTVSGTAIFEFTSSYAGGETFPILFNQYAGTGNVVIRPAASVSSALVTSGSPSAPALIDFNGVKNITIDGRPGGAGSSVMWQFQNTTSNGTLPTFLFINGAQYDTLEYLTIQARGTSSTATVLLSTSTVSGGNSYNLISNCNIGDYSSGYPYNPILSNGTAGANANANNTIVNNNIYNFACYTNTGTYYGGVNVTATGNGSNWTINGNSFYSTINPLSQGSNPVHAIYFNAGTTSTGNVISGNYIGGQQAQCGGAYWQVPAYGANGYGDFDGIYVSAGGTSIVTNNTIQNIFMASKYGSSTFRGINIVAGAAIVKGNVIGSASTRGSIVSGLYGTMMGIQNQSTSAVTIDSNVVANFISDGRSFVSGTSGTTTGTTLGIYCYSGSVVVGSNTVTNNKVFNFSRIDNYNNNLYFPIPQGGGDSTGSTIGGYWSQIIAGICVQTASTTQQTVSKNTVYNLYDSLTGSSNTIWIHGIVCQWGNNANNTINGNFIYGLWAPNNFSTNATNYAGFSGIYIPGNVSTTYNITDNIIDLGYRPTDGSSVQKAMMTGIWDNTTFNNVNLKFRIIHNSVYIGGSDNTTLNSFAFKRRLDYTSTVYDSLIIRNNIFFNNRTSTGGGRHFGMYLNSLTDVSSDYNDVYGTGTGFKMFGLSGSDYTSLATYQAVNTGFETHSISADPQYSSASTATPDLHIINSPGISPVDQAGAAGTLTYDYDSLLRANYSPVDIGATVVCTSVSSSPSVSLTVSQDTFCAGTSITFTATTSTGGTSPNYNFYLNGVSVQNGSAATYVSSSLNNNDSVKVVMTSSAACVAPSNATSNSITVSVTSGTVTPSVAIGASVNNVCHGTAITFTATPTNGGSSPTYTFYRNGVLSQNGSLATYTNIAINNGDSLWVVMTSNAACVSPTTATSGKVYMVINPTVVPSVTITPTQTSICTGSSVTFTANATNGGGAPSYTFFVNGGSVQSGSSNTFSSTTIHNSDSVWAVVASNAPCASPTSATSTKVHMTVSSSVLPTVSISSSSGSICQGTLVTFTASSTFGGTAPNYNFYLNGSSVQSGSGTTYSTTALNDNDSVWVVLTSNAACASQTVVISSTLYTTVSPIFTTYVTLNVSSNTICSGTPVTFTAYGANGGSAPLYVFYVNGTSMQSGSSTTFSSSSLHNNDVVHVEMTSNAFCPSPVTSISPNITITVHQTAVTTLNQSICAGSSISFNGNNLTQAGIYKDTLNTVYGCDSVITLTLSVNSVLTSQFNQNICSGSSYNFNGQQLNVAGTYADTLTSTGGCDSIITLNLAVVSTVTSQLSDSTCEGHGYNFNGQQLTASGVYLDTLTSSGGCDSVITLNLTVTAAPVVIRPSGDSLVTGQYSSYQWLLNGSPIFGATTPTFVALVNGVYSVVVTNSFGCTDTSAGLNVQGVGVLDLNNDINISLYPNPTSGDLNLSIQGMKSDYLVMEMFDLQGQLLISRKEATFSGNNSTYFNLNEFSAGVYFLHLQTEGVSVVRSVEIVR